MLTGVATANLVSSGFGDPLLRLLDAKQTLVRGGVLQFAGAFREGKPLAVGIGRAPGVVFPLVKRARPGANCCIAALPGGEQLIERGLLLGRKHHGLLRRRSDRSVPRCWLLRRWRWRLLRLLRRLRLLLRWLLRRHDLSTRALPMGVASRASGSNHGQEQGDAHAAARRLGQATGHGGTPHGSPGRTRTLAALTRPGEAVSPGVCGSFSRGGSPRWLSRRRRPPPAGRRVRGQNRRRGSETGTRSWGRDFHRRDGTTARTAPASTGCGSRA